MCLRLCRQATSSTRLTDFYTMNTDATKKKVLIMIDALGIGGAERSLVAFLQMLDYSRMDVDLMIEARGGELEQLVHPAVNIISFKPVGGLRALAARLIFSAMLRIAKVTAPGEHDQETRWKCVGWLYPECPKKYDVAIAYQQGYPLYYITERVNATHKYGWINIDLKGMHFNRHFNRPFYDRIDCAIAVSDQLKEIILRDGYAAPEKLDVIYDIVFPKLVRRQAEDTVSEKDLFRAPLKITTVARLAGQKNFPLAVHTAALLKSRGVEFEWVIVGDGPERQNIERLIARTGVADCLKLVGKKVNPYPYIKACDIYVQTSSIEGYCLTLAEARALAKPLVSTRFPIVDAHIVPGENGYIAESTPESMADCITKIASDPALSARMGQASLRSIGDNMDTVAAKINSLILK